MTTGQNLEQELQKVLSGQPWYGSPVYDILSKVTFDVAFERPPGHAHTIAEVLLHMLAWTEEVMDRMNGMTAGVPSSGDWPEPGNPDEQKWQRWMDDFKLANTNLARIISDFPDAQWKELIDDKRETEPVTTYEQLITGFLKHQIYHAGQIAILTKVIGA